MKKISKTRMVRRFVQLLFFVIVMLVVLGHTLEESGITIPFLQGASLHAICPFGGVVTIYQYITTGSFVQKIHESSFYLMIIVFITAIIAGPIFCGWVCPLGTFQEWIGKIGKKIFKKRYNHIVPKKLDTILRYLRYGVLLWVVIITATSAKLIFAEYDPYYALFNFYTGEVAITAFIALGIVIILSLFVERPFCKYACPYGALLGLTNLFRIFSIRRNESTCISCSKCDKACPMNIEVSSKKKILDHQCISCFECTSEVACPIDATVELSTSTPSGKKGTKDMKIRALTVAILLIVIILGGVLILKVSGLWITEGSKVPTKITTGEFSGVSNPADIRGSYTFEDININFNIPAEITAKAFSINISDEEAKSFQAKELELIYGELEDVEGDIGTDSIKLFVSLYLGIPFTAEEDTYLPSTAIELLLQEGKITQEEFNELSKRSYNIQTLPTIQKVEIEKDSTPIASVEIEIKGNTTFNDLISWGLTTDEIEKVIDGPIASKTMTIRDAATQNGAEFSVYKNSLLDVLNNK